MHFSLLFLIFCPLIFAACPSGTVYNGNFNKCYKFQSTAAAYLVAEENCMAMGGHLTSTSNAFENSFILNTAKSTFGGATEFWLGANLLMSTSWSWTDRSPMSYTNWAAGQPDPMFQCASEMTMDGTWRAASCSTAKPYVCGIPYNTITPTGSTSSCPSGWTYFSPTNSCYKLYFHEKFDDAESRCSYQSAHLVSIHSQAENDFVIGMARTNEDQSWDNQVWIGLKKDNVGGVYWTDGSRTDFLNWAPGQPNKSSEKCTQLLADVVSEWGYSNAQSKWNDISCTDTMRAYVCKKPAM